MLTELLLYKSYCFYNLVFDWLILHICRCLCYFVNNLDTLCNLTESGILTVKVRCILVHNEELA